MTNTEPASQSVSLPEAPSPRVPFAPPPHALLPLFFVLFAFLGNAPLVWAGPSPAEALAPVAFLVGEHRGRGQHPWGAYDETFTGEWINGRTAVLVRSKSVIGGRTVFQDVRVVSYDAKAGRLRARQFAMGDAATYDVRVKKDGTVVWEETAREGGALGPWRYTFTPAKSGGGFSYRVDQRKPDGQLKPDDRWTKYVTGELKRRAPDVNEDGPLRTRTKRIKLGWPAEVHSPVGDGRYPLIVFSPGGAASSYQGYAGFGRRWASWGFVVVIVAFADGSATERAPKFGKVVDALKKRTDGDVPWDQKIAIAAGHSRGGHAAILAAHANTRFGACLAIAPAGPEGGVKDAKHNPATFIVVGDKDRFQETCRKLHSNLKGPHLLATIEGMNHMCAPAECGRKMLARTTAFLMARVAGKKSFEIALTKPANGVTITEPAR